MQDSVWQSFENGSINFDLRTGYCMPVKSTLLWKSKQRWQLQALLNAEKVKKVEGKKSKKKWKRWFWESFFEVLEITVCILMAKFQATTEFVLCYEGSSSTTWIWWARENLWQLLGGDSTCYQITISSNGKRLKDSNLNDISLSSEGLYWQ